MKSIRRATPTLVSADRAEQRNEMLFLHGGVNAGAKLLLRQPALVEELGQQRVVRFGDVLDQFAVQLVDLVLPLRPWPAPRVNLPRPAGGVVSDDLVAQDVQHLVEAGAGIDRQVHGKDARAVMLARRRQHLVKMRIEFVHRVDHQDLGDAEVRGVIPDPLGADADAVLGMDDDQGEVGHAQRAEGLADEVQVAGSVNDVELLAHPFGVEQGGLHGNLALLFAGVVIGDRACRRRCGPCGR